MSFDKTPLNEFITLQRGFDLPKDDRIEGNVPVIASTGIGGYHNEAKVAAPGVVIGRSGSIGGGQYIEQDFWPLNTTLWVKDFKGHDPRYVYYLMRSIDFSTFNVGSGVPTLNRNHLSSLLVNEQGLESEQRIAKHLGDIDDKIAVNTQINQTLEEMAQAIFKSWFVDFDPVKAKMNGEQPEGMDEATAALFPDQLVESELGLIPEGWAVGSLRDVAKYCSARTSIDSVTLENYISTENMLAEKMGVTAASKLPTAKIIAAYKTGDILVSNIRPYFKKIWLAEGNGGRSNDVLGFESSSLNTSSYLMNLLYQDSFFEYMTRTSKGAKMPRGDKTAIMNWEMAVPPVKLRETFSTIVDKFYKLIPQNRAQSETLESLRDTLLPRLLTGEIDLNTNNTEISNLDISSPEIIDKIAPVLLELIDFGIESRARQQSLPKGYVGLVTINGTFGSNGGTHVHVPKAIRVLSKLTSVDGVYGEIAGNIVTEMILPAGMHLVTNNIMPLGLLTKLCTAIFGKKTPITPRDAIVLTAIHEAKNKTFDGIMNEQSKRFTFLDMPIMNEEELKLSLKYLQSIGVIKNNGETITLLDSIVQH